MEETTRAFASIGCSQSWESCLPKAQARLATVSWKAVDVPPKLCRQALGDTRQRGGLQRRMRVRAASVIIIYIYTNRGFDQCS